MTISTQQQNQSQNQSQSQGQTADQSSATLKLVDASERERALDIERSICVTAPAGSGKTELLTQRILKLLTTVTAPESILAITFTRKAAAEMRERVVAALELGLNSEPPTQSHRRNTWQLARAVLQRDQQYQWQLLGNPGRLRLQTIDSLCQSITNDLPVVSQLGARLAPVDDPAALYQLAVDAFIAELDARGEQSREIKALIGQLLLHLDNNVSRLQRLLVAMLPIRDQWLSHAISYESSDSVRDALEQTLRQWIEQELSLLAEYLQPWESELCSLADFAASQLLQTPDKSPASMIRQLQGLVALPAAGIQHFSQWQGVLELLYTTTGSLRKKVDVRQGFPSKTAGADTAQKAEFDHRKKAIAQLLAELDAGPAVLKQQLAIVSGLPGRGYEQQHWQILEPLALCLVRVVAHLRVVFGQTGQCDFNEITASALRALQSDITSDIATASAEQNKFGSAIAYKWHQNIQHILVDEFQDTSVAQFELLQLLTAEWQQENASGSGPIKTLFVVGDGMQSIYRFRAAQVGLFLRLKSQGIGDLPLDNIELVQNFRSSEAIVEWNNRQFGKAFPDRIDIARGAVPYAAAQSIETVNKAAGLSAEAKSNPAASAIEVAIASGDDASQAEAAHIVAAILSYQSDPSLKSIAILVRTRGYLNDILPALDEANIAWQGIDLVPLKNREVVIDCLSLTRALLNPADHIAWLAMLRAPWCGLTLPDIQLLVDAGAAQSLAPLVMQMLGAENVDGFVASIDGLSSDGQQRFMRFASTIAPLWQTRSRKTLRQWVEAAWVQLNGPLIASYGDEGDDRESVYSYFDLLERLEQEAAFAETTLNIELIEQRLEKLYARSSAHIAVNRSDNRSEKSAENSSARGTDVGLETETEKPPVQVMTIHKSKGLEFDAVIIPGLDRKARGDDRPILAWREHLFGADQAGLVLCPVDATASYASATLPHAIDEASQQQRSFADLAAEFSVSKSDSADLYEFLRDENKRAADYEATRLLYVAATRARSRLLLTAKLNAAVDPPQSTRDLKTPSSNSLLAKLWPSLVDEAVLVSAAQVSAGDSVADDAEPILPVFKRLKSELQDTAGHGQAAAALSSTDDKATAVQQTHLEHDTDASTIGTLVHKVFEQIAYQGLGQWSDVSVENRSSLWRLRLQQSGVASPMLDDAVALVEQAVHNAISSELGHWVFDESHRFAVNEWSLSCRRDANTIQHYIIDRSFIDSNNCRWVIDYKIAQPETAIGLGDFIEQQKINYSAQLNNYKMLVELFDNTQGYTVAATKTALYLPLINQLVEIE